MEIEFNITGFKIKDMRALERAAKGDMPVNDMVEFMGRWIKGGAEVLDELDVEVFPVLAKKLSDEIGKRISPEEKGTGKN